MHLPTFTFLKIQTIYIDILDDKKKFEIFLIFYFIIHLNYHPHPI